MAHQTFITDMANKGTEPNGLIEGVGTFGADLAALAVLQARLAASDLREGAKRSRIALVAAMIGGIICTCGIGAIILGASLWLAANLEIQLSTALIAIGIASLFVAAMSLLSCVRALTTWESAFQRSHEELERNLAWIKTTLMHSGR